MLGAQLEQQFVPAFAGVAVPPRVQSTPAKAEGLLQADRAIGLGRRLKLLDRG